MAKRRSRDPPDLAFEPDAATIDNKRNRPLSAPHAARSSPHASVVPDHRPPARSKNPAASTARRRLALLHESGGSSRRRRRIHRYTRAIDAEKLLSRVPQHNDRVAGPHAQAERLIALEDPCGERRPCRGPAAGTHSPGNQRQRHPYGGARSRSSVPRVPRKPQPPNQQRAENRASTWQNGPTTATPAPSRDEDTSSLFSADAYIAPGDALIRTPSNGVGSPA
jgi:hypothetical protein